MTDTTTTDIGTTTTNAESRYEEFKVKGDDLIANVRRIVRDGNVSRLFIKHDTGETILEVPLTAGVAVAAAGVILAPALVALSAVAALVTRVTIGVERREPRSPVDSGAESANPDAAS